jgi:fatty-acyl-CoA synthase
MTTPPLLLSHARGTTTPPLQDCTIGQALDATVARHGDREALVVPHQGVRWTWRQLAQQADAVAAGLLAMGLQPGDRVGIWAPNCAEWVLTQLATARAGLVLVNVNPAYRRSELEYALNTRCAPPTHQHPVHQRHHRLPQGRHAHPPQHPEQRLLHRRGIR